VPARLLRGVQAVDGVAEPVRDGVLAFGLENFGPIQLSDIKAVYGRAAFGANLGGVPGVRAKFLNKGQFGLRAKS